MPEMKKLVLLQDVYDLMIRVSQYTTLCGATEEWCQQYKTLLLELGDAIKEDTKTEAVTLPADTILGPSAIVAFDRLKAFYSEALQKNEE